MEDCGEASVCVGLEDRRDRSKKELHLSQVDSRKSARTLWHGIVETGRDSHGWAD